jgi:hypothetical protein
VVGCVCYITFASEFNLNKNTMIMLCKVNWLAYNFYLKRNEKCLF